MVFPESSRVVYANNTLNEVVCELRFPPILKIESAPPADFQEAIREAYPLFEQKKKTPALPPGAPPEVAQMIATEIPGFGSIHYEFGSEDGNWSVGLSKQSLSLASRRYERWEGFRHRVSDLLAALQSTFSPAYLSRIGLRYQNIITRSTLGMLDKPWSELLGVHVIGEMADENVGPYVKAAVRQTVFDLQGGASVQVVQYLAQKKEGGEQVYVIDADYFIQEKTEEVENALDRLDKLNKESGRLFRWCITDELHRAMEPADVEPSGI